VRREGCSEEVVPEVVFVKRYKAMRKKQTVRQSTSKDIIRTIGGMVVETKGQPHFSQRDKELN
jgi:hypothetical protein